MDRREFDAVMRKAESPDQRVAWFGALLTKESGVEVIIVGGSAIEVYTSGEYVSHDIDVVGERDRLASVLRKWGFKQQEGRSSRTYWAKKPLGLVDLVGAHLKSDLATQTFQTPYGSVSLGPPEDLITRRLMRAGAERSTKLFQEAALIANRYKDRLDWEYIRLDAKYENVLPLYEQLRKLVQ
ncbi:MAG: hypothetical protein WBE40_08750 [Thermoplasmata archaeon]